MSLDQTSSVITRRRFVCALSAIPLAARPAFSGVPAVFSQDGISIQGFDPVGYFTLGRPIEGADEFRLRWRNAIWRFASQGNMSVFESDPMRYAPRYGGFCAMSMSQGQLSDSAPAAWAIHGGHLYLAHSVTAIQLWKRTPTPLIASANGHWRSAMRD